MATIPSTTPCGSPCTVVCTVVFRAFPHRDQESTPCIKSDTATKVRFTLDDTIFKVDRLTFGMLRGDVRHPEGSDPDYCSIGQCRHSRLSQFAEVFLIAKTFRAWSTHCAGLSSPTRALRGLTGQIMFPSDFEFDDAMFEGEGEYAVDDEGDWSDSEASSSHPSSRRSSASSLPSSLPSSIPKSLPLTDSITNPWLEAPSELLDVLRHDVSTKALSWTHIGQNIPATGPWPMTTGNDALSCACALPRTAGGVKS